MGKMNIEYRISNKEFRIMKFSVDCRAMKISAARMAKPINLLSRSINPILLRYSAVSCSMFDIHQVSAYAFSLFRNGEGPENRLGLMLMGLGGDSNPWG
jgi:hypothetical protein